jgi:hypothetical protein
MDFCGIGTDLIDSRLKSVDFRSTRAFIDFDAVVVDPAGIHGADYNPHYDRRKTEFTELLALGGSVIWFVRALAVHPVLPIGGVQGNAYSGTKMEFVGPDEFRDFWKAIEPTVEYEAYLNGAFGQPLVKVRSSNKTVASWIRKERGLILLIPCHKNFRGPGHQQQVSRTLLNAIEALLERIQPKSADFSLPPWSLRYGWPIEAEIRHKLRELETTAEETARGIAATSKELEQEEKLKLLFTAKGETLVDSVIQAFQELGATAQRGEPGRDDVVLSFDNRSAVIEIKGKKGSAAEKDAAQLEKWVAGFKETHESDAKGILIVNAFCDTPLAERNQPAFPDQMLNYSNKREHCLMTSTQLLGMVLSSRDNGELGKAHLNKIFSTVGILDEFSDYKTFVVEAQ